jgi:hypothetical protein
MEDHKIVELAVHVLSLIESDLNSDEQFYKGFGGTIELRWSDKKAFYADAQTASHPSEIAKHFVGLTYETVILMYRDIENYHKYISSSVDNSYFDEVFKGYEYPKALNTVITEEESVRAMFISGITWIFFHEVGHLIQEHGHIRQFYRGSKDTNIVDSPTQVNDEKQQVEGFEAAVSHVTEFAADFYATVSCLRGLHHNFTNIEEFEETLRSFAAVIALIFYRFHGTTDYTPEKIPVGSHPKPLIRLEQNAPIFFEFITPEFLNHRNSKLDRLSIINMTSWASITIGLFWLRKHYQKIIPVDFFLSGSFQRPGMIEYHQVIIATWDEIKPVIDSVKRIDDYYSELKFSDEYREKINSNKEM